MTGPEHYEHAEMLLDMASDEDFGTEAEQSRFTAAQVHATLALAAATALGGDGDGLPADDWDAWYKAASEGPGQKRRRSEARAAEAAELAAMGTEAQS